MNHQEKRQTPSRDNREASAGSSMGSKDRKPRLLFVFDKLHVGGATTALLSLLYLIDYSRFDVDLLVHEHDGPLHGLIPEKTRLLPPAKVHETKSIRNILQKGLSPAYTYQRLRAMVYERVLHRPTEAVQIRSRMGARYSLRFETEYDLAISFMETWPLFYTANHVRARHKLAWIHLDYKTSTLNFRHDLSAFPRFDRIVMVAKQAVENFREICPRYGDMAVYLPNITSESLVRERGRMDIGPLPEGGKIRLVTVCRIQFDHKGLDRATRAFHQLVQRGKLAGVVWYIIGDGTDLPALKEMIEKFGLTDRIICMGQMMQPLPMVAACDAFFLPSRFEGKPIAVTEAMMLGLPALVSRYESAPEQIESGVDGLIVENSDEGVLSGLEALCETPGLLPKLRENVQARHYGNEEDMALYYKLFDEIGV